MINPVKIARTWTTQAIWVAAVGLAVFFVVAIHSAPAVAGGVLTFVANDTPDTGDDGAAADAPDQPEDDTANQDENWPLPGPACGDQGDDLQLLV